MRKCLVLFAVCIISVLGAQEPKASSFYGHVKSVSEKSYKAKTKGGVVVKGKPQHEYQWESDYRMLYDSTGKPISRNWYSGSGKITRTTDYIYDNRRMMAEENSYDGHGKPLTSFLYTNAYDSSGKLTSRVIKASTVSKVTTYNYSYDTNGNIYESMEVELDKNSPVWNCPTRAFDSSWRINEQSIYRNNIALIARHKYYYNHMGQIIEEHVLNASNVAVVIYKWKYDEQNRLVRYEVCNNTGMNCESWTYKDEYDKMGNWTRRVEYRNGKPVYVKEREITYY